MKLKVLIACALALTLAVAPSVATGKKSHAKTSNTHVIYTGDLGKKIYGYNGTTYNAIKDGRIERIEALPNKETPQYFKRATTKIFPQYEGKTIEEARKLHVDAVTGATYSSEAIIKNIKLGLEQAASSSSKGKKGKKK